MLEETFCVLERFPVNEKNTDCQEDSSGESSAMTMSSLKKKLFQTIYPL